MTKKPTILNQKTIATTQLFHIETLEIQFNNGEIRNYERLSRSTNSGAVLIVPMLDNEKVLLIKEYSAGVDRYEMDYLKVKWTLMSLFWKQQTENLRKRLASVLENFITQVHYL
jgi:ADP-ribose diphosphatase